MFCPTTSFMVMPLAGVASLPTSAMTASPCQMEMNLILHDNPSFKTNKCLDFVMNLFLDFWICNHVQQDPLQHEGWVHNA
jgi:hypothetical protein